MQFDDDAIKSSPEFLKYRASVDLSNFPKGFLKTFDGMSEADRLRWFLGRFKCLKYHLYLSGFAEEPRLGEPDIIDYVPILGMDFQEDPHSQLFAQFIQKRPGTGVVLSDLETQFKKTMILWPRGLFKTSSIIVEIVQLILNYPNIRICFLTGGDQLAKRQCARVKRVFEKPTKRFKMLFPEFCVVSRELKKRLKTIGPDGEEIEEIQYEDVPAKLGTAHEFTVPCRTNDTFAEPTFAISTARSVKAGSHFDVIIIDDLVNEQNYRSAKALEKCYQDYIDICPLLEPTGFILMTGTRYSFGDTYQRIQEMAQEEEKQLGKTIWKFSIRDCWSMGCQNCVHTDVYHDFTINVTQPPCKKCSCPGFKARGNRDVLFPQTRTHDGRSIGHTLEFLEGERLRLGPEFFANQYENRPIAADSQTFTETLIGGQTLFRVEQLPAYGQAITIGVGDLAYVGQEGRDYSVLYICRIFQGQIFVIDCLFGNWDSNAVAENTVLALLKHRPSVIYYEKFNGWEAYNNVITAYAATKGMLKVPIQWEKGSQAANAKLIRIGAIKGPLAAKRLWLFGDMPGYQQLVNQLIKWPKLGRHDDFADCLGMVVAAPTGYEQINPPAQESTSNWLRKLQQSEPLDDSYGDNGCGTGICC